MSKSTCIAQKAEEEGNGEKYDNKGELGQTKDIEQTKFRKSKELYGKMFFCGKLEGNADRKAKDPMNISQHIKIRDQREQTDQGGTYTRGTKRKKQEGRAVNRKPLELSNVEDKKTKKKKRKVTNEAYHQYTEQKVCNLLQEEQCGEERRAPEKTKTQFGTPDTNEQVETNYEDGHAEALNTDGQVETKDADEQVEKNRDEDGQVEVPDNFKTDAFFVGKMFESIAEFEAAKKQYEECHYCELWKRDVRTLTSASKRVPKRVSIANKELLYYSLKLSCKFGGKEVKRKETKRKRATRSFR